MIKKQLPGKVEWRSYKMNNFWIFFGIFPGEFENTLRIQKLMVPVVDILESYIRYSSAAMHTWYTNNLWLIKKQRYVRTYSEILLISFQYVTHSKNKKRYVLKMWNHRCHDRSDLFSEFQKIMFNYIEVA